MEGHIAERVFGDRTAGVILITFGRARIVVGRDSYTYDDTW
jgi:hypothetical protein